MEYSREQIELFLKENKKANFISTTGAIEFYEMEKGNTFSEYDMQNPELLKMLELFRYVFGCVLYKYKTNMSKIENKF